MPADQTIPQTASPVSGLHGLPGLVWAFEGDGSAVEIAHCDTFHGHDGWVWLHFNLTDVRCGAYLRDNADLPASVTELLLSAGEHQQLHAEGACIYGVFADLVCDLDGLTDEIGFLHFVVTDRLFLTARRDRLNAAEAMRKSLLGGRKVEGPAALLEAIVGKVAKAVEARAEALADRLDEVEERLIVDVSGNHPQMLARVRRLAVRLHRLLSTQRSLINRFEARVRRTTQGPIPFDTGKLAQRLDWLDHEIVALRDRAHLLQEEVSLKMADQTNRNLQVLAIVTTIFLPATLITGIFGMNVGGLPLEADHAGFVWAMLLLAGASGLVLWLLKKAGLFR